MVKKCNNKAVTRKKSPRSRTSKDAIRKLDNAAKALEMRSNGLSYRQIGKALGVSHVQAYRYVDEYVSQAHKDLVESAEQVVTLELDRLDRLTQGVFPRAVKGDDDGAIQSMLRIMQRRAKLLGLDAPAKAETKIEQSFDVDAYREQMRLTMSSPEAREALYAYNDAVRRAKERAAAGLTTSAKH